jgi:hypothetical protein
MVCFVYLRRSSVRFEVAFAFGCLEVARTHLCVGLVESIACDTTNGPNRNGAQLEELLVRRPKSGIRQTKKSPMQALVSSLRSLAPLSKPSGCLTSHCNFCQYREEAARPSLKETVTTPWPDSK